MSGPPSDKEKFEGPASPKTAAGDATPRAATPDAATTPVTAEVVVATQNIAPAVAAVAPMAIPLAMGQNVIPAGMFPCYIGTFLFHYSLEAGLDERGAYETGGKTDMRLEVEHTHGIYSPVNPSHISPTFHNNGFTGAPGTISTVIRAAHDVARARSAPPPAPASPNNDFPINTIVRAPSAYPPSAINGSPAPLLINITPRIYEMEREREREKERETERVRQQSPAMAEMASRNVNGRLPPHSIGFYVQPVQPQPPPPRRGLDLPQHQNETANHPPINTIVRAPGAPQALAPAPSQPLNQETGINTIVRAPGAPQALAPRPGQPLNQETGINTMFRAPGAPQALAPAPSQPLNQETGTQTHTLPPPGPLINHAPPGQYLSPFPPRTESPHLPPITISPAPSAALAIAPKKTIPLPRIPAVLSSAPLAFASYRNAFQASARSTSALSSAAILNSKPASPASLAQPPKPKPKSTTSTSTNKSRADLADLNAAKVALPKDPNAKEATPKFKEKPHTCSICSRSFARTEHLQRHGLSHTKEKPFECKECGRSFARRDLLVRHAGKLHNGEVSKRIQGRYLGLGNRYSGNEGSRATSLSVGGGSEVGSGANTPGGETRPLVGIYYGLSNSPGPGPDSGRGPNRDAMAWDEPRSLDSGPGILQEAGRDPPQPRPQRPLTAAEQYLAQSYGTNYVPRPSSPEIPSSPDIARERREFVPGMRKLKKKEKDATTQSGPERGKPPSPTVQKRNVQKRPPLSDEVVGDSDDAAAYEQVQQPMGASVANMGLSIPSRQGFPTPGVRRVSDADQYYMKQPVISVPKPTANNNGGSAIDEDEGDEGVRPTAQLLREADQASPNVKDHIPTAEEEARKAPRKRKRSSKLIDNENDAEGAQMEDIRSPPPKRQRKSPKKAASAKPNIRMVKKRSAATTKTKSPARSDMEPPPVANSTTKRHGLPHRRTSSNSGAGVIQMALSPAAAALEAFARSGAKRPPKSIRDLIDFNAPPVSTRRSGAGNVIENRPVVPREASHIIAVREGRGPWSQSRSPEQAKDKDRRKSKHSFEMVEVDSSDEKSQSHDDEIVEGAGRGGKTQNLLVDKAIGKIENNKGGKGHERKLSLPKALRDVMDFNAAPVGRFEQRAWERRARKATTKVLENATMAAMEGPKRRGRPANPPPSEPQQGVEGEEEVGEKGSPFPAPPKRRGRPPKQSHLSPSSSRPPAPGTKESPRDKREGEESLSVPFLVSAPLGRLHRGVQKHRDARETKKLRAIENGHARKTRGGARAGSVRKAKKQQEAPEEVEGLFESQEPGPALRPMKRRGRPPKKQQEAQEEVEDVFEFDEPEPAPRPMKRRGRPPKKQQEAQEEVEDVSEFEEPEPAPKPMKRRGRPPKKQQEAQEEVEGLFASQKPGPAPRPMKRRGRPPKKQQEAQEAQEEVEGLFESQEPGPAPRPMKRRGRPPKKQQEAQDAQEEVEDVFEFDEPEPAPRPMKRRGRPPKVIEEQVEVREIGSEPAAWPAKRRGRPPKQKVEVVIEHRKEAKRAKCGDDAEEDE